MPLDIHAHVTTDVPAQLARMDAAGVDRSVLLMTRVNPEAPADPHRRAQVLGGNAQRLLQR